MRLRALRLARLVERNFVFRRWYYQILHLAEFFYKFSSLLFFCVVPLPLVCPVLCTVQYVGSVLRPMHAIPNVVQYDIFADCTAILLRGIFLNQFLLGYLDIHIDPSQFS